MKVVFVAAAQTDKTTVVRCWCPGHTRLGDEGQVAPHWVGPVTPTPSSWSPQQRSDQTHYTRSQTPGRCESQALVLPWGPAGTPPSLGLRGDRDRSLQEGQGCLSWGTVLARAWPQLGTQDAGPRPGGMLGSETLKILVGAINSFRLGSHLWGKAISLGAQGLLSSPILQ